MNAIALLLSAQTAMPDPAGAPATGAVSVQTALLIIMAGALILVAKSLGKLRARIETLEHDRDASRGETPASPSARPETHQPVAAALDVVPSDAPSDEILAVIAAAIHASIGRDVRIVGITPVPADDRVWSLEGRRQIFHSHKVR